MSESCDGVCDGVFSLRDNTVDVPCADKPDSDENLIYVGGNYLYHEGKQEDKHPTKSFKAFREEADLSMLSEKKSRRKKKGKRNPEKH